MRWLRRAADERSTFIVHLGWDSRFSNISAHPRFAELTAPCAAPASAEKLPRRCRRRARPHRPQLRACHAGRAPRERLAPLALQTHFAAIRHRTQDVPVSSWRNAHGFARTADKGESEESEPRQAMAAKQTSFPATTGSRRA
jgi:hypothetical protein